MADPQNFYCSSRRCLETQTAEPFFTYFQWTEDGEGFQIQYLTLDT